MGRITVFVTDANTACNRVIAAFEARKIPVSVISLSQHPDKRDDMFSLCMQHSTPQVFFNTRLIGGVEPTLELLDEWTASCVPEEPKSSINGGSSISSYSSGGSNSKGAIEKNSRRGSNTSKLSNGTARRSTHSSRSTKSYASAYSRYMAEIGNFHDPHDRRLALPERPPVLSEPCAPRDPDAEFCIAIPGDASTVLEMTQMFADLIKHEDVTVGSVTYKQSFEGFKVIKVLRGTFEVSEKEAFKLASHLLSVGIFVLLNGSSGVTFDVESLYRLQCFQTPGILNSYRIWTESTDSDSIRLIHSLIGKFSEIELASTDKRGYLHVNRARRLPEYWEFEEAICELQGVILSKMNQMTKLAFGINVYNLMIKYATVKLGSLSGKNLVARAVFFSSVKFNIGGHFYSFNDWEHGILRGNSKPPHGLAVPFDKDDPRLNFIVTTSDPRVHFCLSTNHSPGSCPAFGKFTAENLDDELTIAAACFCEDDCNVKVDTNKHELHVSKIFSLYKKDFVKDPKFLPHLLSKYMLGTKKRVLDTMIDDGKSIKIVEIPLEWSTPHCTSGITFDPEILKVDQSRGLSSFIPSPRKSPLPKSPASKAPAPKRGTAML